MDSAALTFSSEFMTGVLAATADDLVAESEEHIKKGNRNRPLRV